MQEYLFGNLFGITQVIIGHPFDTLKTNLQNSKDIKFFINNPIKLYKGISYPLLMNCIGTSFLFGNYDYFYKETNNRLISGILTGMISSVILTPFDYKKIQLQIQQNITTISNNKHNNNNIKKYYTGFIYTFTREIISIPIYFYSYYYLNNYINPFFAGGLAGINSWLLTYPIDTLKTRKQIYQNKTLTEMIKMDSLYKGLSITLLRAFIVNGTSFYIYSIFKK